MRIDDTTLANAIAARLAPVTLDGDTPEDMWYWYGRAVAAFVETHRGGPYKPDDDLVLAVRDRFGRPGGDPWMMAHWARDVQRAIDTAAARSRSEAVTAEHIAVDVDQVDGIARAGFWPEGRGVEC